MQPKILIIEDDERIADMLRMFLEQNGYEAVAAYSGKEGLAQLERLQPNLILLDIMLPDISGFDVSIYVRESADVPIIFMSARKEYGTMVTQMELDGVDFVTKPFRFEELTWRIRSHLA